MSTQETPPVEDVLANAEKTISSVENTILNGPFSAGKINDILKLIGPLQNLGTTQNKNAPESQNSGLLT
jgi:hypothetical protein